VGSHGRNPIGWHGLHESCSSVAARRCGSDSTPKC